MMRVSIPSKFPSFVAAFVLLALGAVPSQAQVGVKGANFLRFDDQSTDNLYGTYSANDPRDVFWNLEMAVDIGSFPGQVVNLKNKYGIKTLVRLGYGLQLSTAELQALSEAPNFGCPQISGFMGRLDSDANNAGGALSAVSGFILGNEANLPGEWGLGGMAYGLVYKCYMQHWKTNPSLASYPLLFAGPGNCGGYNCPSFYGQALVQIGTSAVDGFAIHAYGQTPAAFSSDFQAQTTPINQYKPGAPVYITEYNPGATSGQPLLPDPDAAYFDGCHAAVAAYNADSNHADQIRALLYFVDSPDSWTRSGKLCAPAATPPTTDWWPTSLCGNSARRSAWYNSGATMPPTPQPPPTPPPTPAPTNGAQISITSIPSFVMTGQMVPAAVYALNTGNTTWGSGPGSFYRLGAMTGNGFSFTFPQCGGYYNNNLDARAYTCSTVSPNAATTYAPELRAPDSGVTSATLSVQMVQDGVAWFGNNARQAVNIGQAYCGTALTQCIISYRPDILPFYASNWDTSCGDRDAIIQNWCGIDPAGCNALRYGAPCSAFANATRCPGGRHRDGTYIDTNATFDGYKVCGMDSVSYICRSGGWSRTGVACN
jgi:hypothetical protein